MKKIGIFLSICLILLSGCQMPSGQISPTPGFPPATLPPQPTRTDLPVATLTPSPGASPAVSTHFPNKPLLLETKDLVDISDKLVYSFRVHYPQIFNPEWPGLQAFNDQAKKMANDTMDTYRKIIEQTTATPDPNFNSSFMEMTFDVTNGIHGLLSIHYTVSEYWAGAVHPNSYSRVLNFNLIQGKTIELKDLFLPGANYLQVLADYCNSDLKRQDRLEFPEGAQPTAENYQNWSISPDGLWMYFDPYQVGPYAMGPSEVRIPFTALKGIINSQGPLAALLGQ